jgi:hypothetical protein
MTYVATDRRALPVFHAGNRDFSVGDVLLTIPDRLVGYAIDAAADDARVDSALESWRYLRDLVSAEECEAWLARRGLCYADLHASIARQLRAAPPADADAAEVDALLDAGFDEHARELARHAALARELGLRWPGPDESLALIWRDWQAATGAHCASAFSMAERSRELATHASELTRLEYVEVELDSAAAVREARMCVLEDRIELTAVAVEAGYPQRIVGACVGELPPTQAAVLQHAAVGQLSSPTTEDGRFLLLQLRQRVPPSLDDPTIAAAIDARLRRRRLDALVSRHVQWIWPLHHE